MDALTAMEWSEVARRLHWQDSITLESAIRGKVGGLIRDGRNVWHDTAFRDHSSLVVVLGTKVVEATPTEHGYMLNGVPTSRRMFIHDFVKACRGTVVDTIQAYCGFKPEIAESLGDEFDTLDAAPHFRVCKFATFQDASNPRRVAWLLGRMYIRWRVGAPQRQRGRRARRWTKVCVF